jgi:hypothetical protein
MHDVGKETLNLILGAILTLAASLIVAWVNNRFNRLTKLEDAIAARDARIDALEREVVSMERKFVAKEAQDAEKRATELYLMSFFVTFVQDALALIEDIGNDDPARRKEIAKLKRHGHEIIEQIKGVMPHTVEAKARSPGSC